MISAEQGLDRLLKLISEHIDLEHCRQVDDRFQKALACGDVDRPPLVIQADFNSHIGLPPPWDEFRRYNYNETFENPAAMMQNELLNSVVPGIILKDDNPLAIRNNHGTIQIASVLGASWNMYEDQYPWVEPFNSLDSIDEIALKEEEITLQEGILQSSFATLQYYHKKLNEYPACKEGIQISLPDLEGPMNTAEQLWGSSIYYAFYDHASLLNNILSKVVDTMLAVISEFRTFATDRLDPDFNTQHGYVIGGRILSRNDSCIMLSSEMYRKYIRPHDDRLLHKVGKGSIHFCGNGQHLIDEMIEIPDLIGLDFGDPNYMDINSIYSICSERNVSITNLQPLRQDLMSGKARKDYPTGTVFVYFPANYDDALQVVSGYYTN